MKKVKKICLLIIIIVVSSNSFALPMEEALDEAAAYFVKAAVKIERDQELHILQVVNFNTGKNDFLGKKLETEMYFALEKQTPDFKLFFGKGEKEDKAIYLKGSYEKKATVVAVKFQVVMGNEILAQYEFEYDVEKTHRQTLVAVLDIEAESLNQSQRKAFSDIFRTALSQTKAFDIASSADIDKMDPDQIQKSTGCTRDTCATIIGEQLGVDRVISSSFYELDKDLYVLTGKVMDIKDRSILVSETVEHSGSIRGLKTSLEKLARKIVGDTSQLTAYKEPPAATSTESSDLVWHIAAIAVTVLSAWQSMENATQYNDLVKENEEIIDNYNLAISQAQLTQYQNEFEENKQKMAEHDSNIQMFDAIAALAILGEMYLLFFSSDDDQDQSGRQPDRPANLTFRPNPNGGFTPRLSLTLKW